MNMENRNSVRSRWRHWEDTGSILVLTAFAAVMLLAIVGLLIDSALLSSGQTEHEQATDLAVLKAAEVFTRPAPDTATALNNAATAASASLAANLQSNVVNRQAANGGTWGNISVAGVGTPGENGILYPGTWYFSEPFNPASPGTGCDGWRTAGLGPATGTSFGLTTNCPCSATDSWNGPCFRPVEPGVTNEANNALQLSLRTDAGDGVNPLFGSIFDSIGSSNFAGGGGVELGSTATVALVPRQLLFLVDLSGSIVETSHPLQSYTFSGLIDLNAAPGSPNYGAYQTNCGALPSLLGTPQNISFSSASFSCRDFPGVPGDTVDDGSNVYAQPSFLIDQSTPPEPLRSILTGTHHVMYDLRSRSVGADRLGFVGFDDNILDIRATLSGGTPGLVAPTDAEFDAFFNATKVSPGTYSDSTPIMGAAISNLYDRMLFPRTFSGERLSGPKGALSSTQHKVNSDLAGPLGESINIFDATSGGTQADSHIFLFTDGLGNCVSSLSFLPGGSTSPDICGDTPDHYFGSMNQIFRSVVPGLVTRGVSLHVFLAGEASRPHTIVRAGADDGFGSPSGCLTEGDGRALAQDGTISGTENVIGDNRFNNSANASRNVHGCDGSTNDCLLRNVDPNPNTHIPPIPGLYDPVPGNPLLLPNLLYYAAARTGGTFVPIRPPCAPGNDAAALEALCIASGESEGEIVHGTVGSNFVDEEGRLLCDVAGRSVETQVTEAIQQILSFNPYVLVAER